MHFLRICEGTIQFITFDHLINYNQLKDIVYHWVREERCRIKLDKSIFFGHFSFFFHNLCNIFRNIFADFRRFSWEMKLSIHLLYAYAWMKSEMSGNLSFPREFSSFLCCICTEQMQRIPEEKKDFPTYLFSSLTYAYSRYINSYF